LGEPWFLIVGYRVYLPWRLFEWWFAFDAYAPEVFEEGGVIAAAGGIAGALFAIVNSGWRARQSQLVTTYGSARWATPKEIKAAGLFASKGVFLGRLENNYLRHDGPEHVMCFAPTRSGKGVGLVLPTLLSWTSSAVVHDIKGENWELTSGWRST
ncbi:type IV secretory system conjugative DNA transfer family protein, partial [Pseudomonas fluorescens]|nr:type IV secretory system conjugative DNA transfer family protein [Pseudomonas fluorescens]